VTVDRVLGHRDLGKTACPGDGLYDQLGQIRSLVESGAPFTTPAARVSAALADYTADYGQTIPVTGALAGPDGNPIVGQQVEVQVNSDNAWRTARRVVTDGNGAYATDLRPSKRMYVRVRFAGSADVAATSSPRLLLRLRPLVTFTRPPKRGVHGRRLSLKGTVAPRKRVVNLVFQQRIRGRWRTVGRRAVRTSKGGFATSFVPGLRASYRYYAAVKSDLDTDRGATRKVSLRVR
jgi:hypothetical protein